jgi:hypothetical protein
MYVGRNDKQSNTTTRNTQNRKQNVQNKKTNIKRVIKKHKTNNYCIKKTKRHKANSSDDEFPVKFTAYHSAAVTDIPDEDTV